MTEVEPSPSPARKCVSSDATAGVAADWFGTYVLHRRLNSDPEHACGGLLHPLESGTGGRRCHLLVASQIAGPFSQEAVGRGCQIHCQSVYRGSGLLRIARFPLVTIAEFSDRLAHTGHNPSLSQHDMGTPAFCLPRRGRGIRLLDRSDCTRSSDLRRVPVPRGLMKTPRRTDQLRATSSC